MATASTLSPLAAVLLVFAALIHAAAVRPAGRAANALFPYHPDVAQHAPFAKPAPSTASAPSLGDSVLLASLAAATSASVATATASPSAARCTTAQQRRLLTALAERTALFDFRPPALLQSGDLASMLVLLRKQHRPPYEVIHLPQPCGGTAGMYLLESEVPWPEVQSCSLRWNADNAVRSRTAVARAVERGHDRPTLVVLPGVGGSRDSVFSAAVVRLAYEYGWRVCAKGYRGCKVPLTSAYTFTLGGTLDLEATLRELRSRYPKSPLYLTGFSMGANVVSRFLGTTNADPKSDLYHGMAEVKGRGGRVSTAEAKGGVGRVPTQENPTFMRDVALKNQLVLLLLAYVSLAGLPSHIYLLPSPA